MKKIINAGLAVVVAAAAFTACNRDFLNTLPESNGRYPADATWSDPALSEAFVTDIYNVYHDGLLNQESMDCISDNCLFNFGRMDIMEANISPSNLGWVNNTYAWGEMYIRIRAANTALANLSVSPIDKTLADRL